jgi:O-antigen biosynthesis protein
MQKFPLLVRQMMLKIKKKSWRETLALFLNKGADILTQPKSRTPLTNRSRPSIDSLPLDYQIILTGLLHSTSFSEQIPLPQFDKNEYLHFIWIVPSFYRGSGGHKNIFRFIKGLEILGHKCTIYIVDVFDFGLSCQEFRNLIREYFELIDAEVKVFNPKQVHDLSTDIVVATSWLTAYAALIFSARLKLYFVQDFEPLFFSSGSYWHLANNTYQLGFYHITYGPWLTSLLRKQHQVEADSYEIVVDKSLYYPRQQVFNSTILRLSQKSGLKICFYGRSVTPRRCFEIVVMALYLFIQEVRDITIVCYGGNEIPTLPFGCINLGILELEELAELYSVSDICIAPSSTNLSAVAHEIMACGSILMEMDTENTALNLTHLSNSYLVKPDPKAMCDGLLELFQNPQLRVDLKKRSLTYAQQLLSWDKQVETFEKLVKDRLKVTQDGLTT